MPMVKLDQRAYRVIQSELLARNLPFSIRIEICSTGCCDASLGLRPDEADVYDVAEEIADLKFIMNSNVCALVGEVSISYVDEDGRRGFMITSKRPLNEWEGFAICDIKH